jgi:predicted amidophosphoribosyltransferase
MPRESDEELAICPQCREQKYGFERARSYGQHEGALARAILLLKYERIEPLGHGFADRLVEVIRADGERLWEDRLVPCRFTGRERKNAGSIRWNYLCDRWPRRLGIACRPV